MIQLIRLTDILYCVLDSILVEKNQVPIGNLRDAKLYLKDIHNVSEVQVKIALSEMDKTRCNAADFGYMRGDFMFTSNKDVGALLAQGLGF